MEAPSLLEASIISSWLFGQLSVAAVEMSRAAVNEPDPTILHCSAFSLNRSLASLFS